MLKVALCGGSGYTGVELIRILAGHGGVELTAVTSEKSAGKRVADLFPHLRRYGDLVYHPMEKEKLVGKADIFFLALPHAASQEAVDYFFRRGKKVIDLSADYRLSDPKTYEQWYATPHAFTGTLAKAVYGLPEIYRSKIRKARLVANPGCYPTAAILGLMPAVKAKLIDPTSIVIDSKSGTTGAGRKADIAVSFCEVNEGFKAYGIATHRHTPEIEQEVSALAGKRVFVNFTPHLLPVDRGILSTIYAPVKKGTKEAAIRAAYEKAYRNEPFVRVLAAGVFPNIKNVRGSNVCHVGLKLNTRTNTLIVVTAIDNLVKGASGQAVHNMNLMCGFEETTGLESGALFP
jgi:N-acetyl-gamma-glutamyl-phosphate reductase